MSAKDESAFLQMLFNIKGERDHLAFVVPWKEKVAIISAWNPGNANITMGIFDIPMKDAKRFVKIAGTERIEVVSIPPLMADNLLEEGEVHNIAPHLYLIWSVGDGEPFHEYYPDRGFDYFSMTGILEAISEAEDTPYPDEERLGVPKKAMTKWMEKLSKSKDSDIRKFAAYLDDIHGKGHQPDGHDKDQDDEDDADIWPEP